MFMCMYVYIYIYIYIYIAVTNCVGSYTQPGYDISGCGGNTTSGSVCSASCSAPGAIVMTTVNKTPTNPWFNQGNPVGFAAGGIDGIKLNLIIGVTYLFDTSAIALATHPLYITDS